MFILISSFVAQSRIVILESVCAWALGCNLKLHWLLRRNNMLHTPVNNNSFRSLWLFLVHQIKCFNFTKGVYFFKSNLVLICKRCVIYFLWSFELLLSNISTIFGSL